MFGNGDTINIIDVKNLNKNYTIREVEPGFKGAVKGLFNNKKQTIKAIKNLNLAVKEGEVVGLIGANGAGKTTLIKILCGILYPSSGQVRVLNTEPCKRANYLRKNISLIAGNKNQLSWDISSIESFRLTKYIYEINEKDFVERLKYLSSLFNIEEILNKPVRNLSLGQRMKCEIVNCLLNNPKVIFLDEPTLGLDITSQKNIRKLIKKYAKDNKSAVIITSHYMKDILETADRIIIMNSGEKIIDTNINEFLSHYQLSKKVTVGLNNDFDVNTFNNWKGMITESDSFNVSLNISNNLMKDFLKFISSTDLDIEELKIEDTQIEEIIEKFIS